MCSIHLHSLAVCQSLHRPGSLFVVGSARFVAMISYFSKDNRDVLDSELLSAQYGARIIRPRASEWSSDITAQLAFSL